MPIAVMTRTGHLLGGLERWRRTTGVLRAELAAMPLLCHLHPLDAPALWRLWELAEHRDAEEVVRLGRYGMRVPCRLQLERWVHGRAALCVEALEPLPVSAWWVPPDRYPELPPMPNTLRA